MILATWHWHIEISSKCTLRCAQQEVPDTSVKENGFTTYNTDVEVK